MNDAKSKQQRRDRHDRKRLTLGVAGPCCVDCQTKKLAALRMDADGRVRCANCKIGDAPLSPAAAKHKLARFCTAGYASPACVLCGNDILRQLQFHHIAGEANSELGVPLCANCHAVISDDQEDLPMDPDLRLREPDRDPHLRQAAMLEGLAVFFGLLIIMLIAWAAWHRAAAVDLAAAFGPTYWQAITMEAPR